MQSHHLKKEMSSLSLLFISFAAIFGSGWLFAPFYAAQIAGPGALLSWVLGALISIVIGMTMAEVITLYPEAGGVNSVSAQTHGSLLGTVVTLLYLLVFVLLPALEVRAIIQYAASHFKFLMLDQDRISITGYAFAFGLLAILHALNLLGVGKMSRVNNVIVVLKMIAPILICTAFISVMSSRNEFHLDRVSLLSAPSWKEIFEAIATSGIIFSYNGFNQATVFAAEAKNPKRSIPFAILGSILLAGLFYFVIQGVFLLAVPQESLSLGWKKVSFPGDQGPFAGLAILLGLKSVLGLIYADAVLSPAGTALSYASAAPRLFFSLGKQNQSLKHLISLNQAGVPYLSIVITFALECIALLVLPSLKGMISILVAAFVLCYTVAPASLLVLRKLEPTLNRPFRLRLAPLMCFLSVLFSNLMVLSCGWMALRNLLFTSGTLFLGYLAYEVSYGKKASDLTSEVYPSFWFFLQMVLLAALSFYSKQMGLSFEVEFGLVLLLSALCLYLAQRMNKGNALREF
jgi:amino acid transporter